MEQEMDSFGVITSCIIGKILACYNFHWFGVQGLESLDDEKNRRKKKNHCRVVKDSWNLHIISHLNWKTKW